MFSQFYRIMYSSKFYLIEAEAATRGVLWEKVFLEACNLQKETLAQVFSCEFCEISKNTFFTDHLLGTVSLED